MTHAPITTARTGWQDILLVCRKCSKKLDGGFGPEGDEVLRDAIRRALRDTGRRRSLRVIPVGCFGLCPKRAVTIAQASRPDRLMAVRAGTGMDTLLRALDSEAGIPAMGDRA